MKANLGTSKQKITILAFLIAGLAGCGGGTSGGLPVGGTTSGGGTSSGGVGNNNSNPAASIVITQPLLNAIQNLGNGNYKIKMSAIVSDKEGNAVADGTVVNLYLVDSVIARGTINATGSGDSISGSSLTDAAPLEGGVDYATDASTDVATDFVTAAMQRATINNTGQYVWGNFEYIKPGDHVILQTAEKADLARIVSAVSASTITVGTAYTNTYPNAIYDSSATNKTPQYFIGRSLLSASVAGTDASGNETVGSATTVGGIAEFYVTYPAVVALNTGCTSDGYDYRTNPKMDPYKTGGAYLIASLASDITVSAVNPFCFAGIAGSKITPDVTTILSSASVSVTIVDGGDGIPIPYTMIGYTQAWSAGGPITVTTSSYGHPYTASGFINPAGTAVTDSGGTIVFNINAPSPTTGEVDLFYSDGGSAKITVNVK